MANVYSESDFKRIFKEVSSPIHDQVREKSSSERRPPIFQKVYKAPGYPVDPRLELARQSVMFLNLEYKGARIIDRAPLKHWLEKSAN